MNTRDMIDAQVQAFIQVQARANEIAADRGYPLTTEEIYALTKCSRCGDVNDCTCGE